MITKWIIEANNFKTEEKLENWMINNPGKCESIFRYFLKNTKSELMGSTLKEYLTKLNQ